MRALKLTPSVRVCGLGLVWFVALIICSHHFLARGAPVFLIWLAVAGVAYLLAVREFFSAPKFPKLVVVIGLGLAAACHLLFLLKAPGTDDDIRRYVWDGRVQRLGYNPYLLIPADPALTALHTSETRTLNNADLATPYPPGAELFFRAVTSLHESVFAMKVAFVICAWAIVFVLFDILRFNGEGTHWVLAYAWHPLVAIEVAGSGHIDIVGALLLAISAAALVRRRQALAALAFALAVSVKFLPIVLVPLYWKRIRLRDCVLAIAVFAGLYIPFLHHGHIATGSLGAFIQHYRFNGQVFSMLVRIVPPQVVAAFAVLLGVSLAIWTRSYCEFSSRTFAWPMTASLLCAPVVYPWYLLWMIPFLRSIATLPIMIWTVSIIPAYYVWHLRDTGRPWILPGWALLIEYGSVVIASMLVTIWSFRRATVSHAPDLDEQRGPLA
jgi:alpha-1,6-mannosyltransferase